jgi:hypothetical protein
VSPLISKCAKIDPAVQHPQAVRRDLGRSEAEGAKSGKPMEDQAGDGPIHVLCPQYRGSKIAIPGIAVGQSISNATEHQELTTLDPAARRGARARPARRRECGSLCIFIASSRRSVDQAIAETVYVFKNRRLSCFSELAPQVLDVFANPHRAGRLVSTDHSGDLRGGD